MVTFRGDVHLRVVRGGMSSSMHRLFGERPPDPNSFLNPMQLEEKADMLLEWWQGKKNVFALTGAGMSTDSGIPDYRGNNGSYHLGHKPMIHQEYMESEFQRKRYWGRSMVGWKGFDLAEPNQGHFALAELEKMMYLGISMDDKVEYYEPDDTETFYSQPPKERRLAIVTQNVDTLHERAGSKDIVHLHGRGNLLKCMKCGMRQNRIEFQSELEKMNGEWLREAQESYSESKEMRPDGDAQVNNVDYNHVNVPNCPHCKTGFMKPDVVFFGDVVPKERVNLCQAAVEMSDGILVVGSSLAVHSAFRYVRAAAEKGTPVAVVNVGETRAEIEGLSNVLKVESPASDTLSLCLKKLAGSQYQYQASND